MTAAKRLIVTADGLGTGDAANRGAIEAHRRGIVTSASFTVNGPAAAAVPPLAQDVPGLGIGLNLTFAGAPALLAPARIPTLADAEGQLPRTVQEIERARPDDLLAEARAQLRRFRELLGRDPTHLDARDRAQRHPGVLETVLVLAWETGFPVRNASRDVHERLRREGIRTTDQVAAEFDGEAATLEALVNLLSALPLGTAELTCRPTLGEGPGPAGPGSLHALTHRDARQALQAAGVRLIHFGEL
jgi:predicted glycoside hydrolase/deacetylase ChbG (UPF0249 family)